MADLRRAVSAAGPVNEDFNPILYFYHLRYWMSQYQVRFGVFEACLVGLLAIYMIRLRPISLAVFCGGFAASALEVVLLMAFQILFGSLYFEVGVIVTTFMLGLVVGAAWINRRLTVRLWCRRPACTEHAGETPAPQRLLIYLALAIALFAACLPPVLIGLGKSQWCATAGLSSSVGGIAIPLLTLLLAVLVGMEFPLAAQLDYQNAAATSSRYYTADYLGAALGALLVSTWLIPVLGVTLVCLSIAALNLLAAGALRWGRHSCLS